MRGFDQPATQPEKEKKPPRLEAVKPPGRGKGFKGAFLGAALAIGGLAGIEKQAHADDAPAAESLEGAIKLLNQFNLLVSGVTISYKDPSNPEELNDPEKIEKLEIKATYLAPEFIHWVMKHPKRLEKAKLILKEKDPVGDLLGVFGEDFRKEYPGVYPKVTGLVRPLQRKNIIEQETRRLKEREEKAKLVKELTEVYWINKDARVSFHPVFAKWLGDNQRNESLKDMLKDKREGKGSAGLTPWPLIELQYHADRENHPELNLPQDTHLKREATDQEKKDFTARQKK